MIGVDPGVVTLLGAAVLIVIAVLAGMWLRHHRSVPAQLRRAIAAVSSDSLQQVVLPDGLGGEIQIEYLLLTPHGLLVLDVKYVDGVIFAGERMEQWTVINPSRRYTFPNPLTSLQDRVAAVRRIARDVPVAGRVVFADSASFAKGHPDEVVLLGELTDHFPVRDGPGRSSVDAFRGQWEMVRAEAVDVA